MKTRPFRRRRDRGVLLGVVLILLGVVLLAGALAISSVRSDTASAGADRLSRQLFNCAEQGLEYGKQFFGSADWTTYLNANTVCATSSPLASACYPNGPLHPGTTTPATTPYPITGTATMSGNAFNWAVAIYDNDEKDELGTQDYTLNKDGQVVVYSRCVDPNTGQSRAVTAMIMTTVPSNIDYAGQAGFGMRNQGNLNLSQ